MRTGVDVEHVFMRNGNKMADIFLRSIGAARVVALNESNVQTETRRDADSTKCTWF